MEREEIEKNNIKYLINSVALLGISLDLNYITFYLNNIYNHFDITGISKTIQMMMTIILLIISIICLVKSIKTREKGVDYLFNKFMFITFIIYTVLSIFTYVYVRSSEENISIKMSEDIKNYSEEQKEDILKKNKINVNIKAYRYSVDKIKNKKSAAYDFYSTLADGLGESEYAINDKYYERKKEIIKQIENSSVIERYVSMLFYNYSYDHYSTVISNEVEYYSIFLKFFLIGVFEAMFYLFNSKEKESGNVFYNKNNV